MKWMGLNEIREKYLSFFESKNHLRLPSASLVPINDKSLLLINSGMAPLKKYFLGEVTPPSKRVTTCQKCIRTDDIENVGRTDRHGTYFEMLGNFSFGDYFKKEAIEWAWEFTIDVMGLPEEKVYVSVYEEDDEAYSLWTDHMKIPKSKVVRLGKKDNFWEHGAGPSGPCSELHYDRGIEHGCDKPDCGVGCECDRYLEFWNLVFTQFDSDGKGKYTPLKNPNIDTGMGLERMAAIVQGVDTLFDVDINQNTIEEISNMASVKYHDSDKIDVSLRVITDHIRSTVFLVADGVMPSNEGRGYVLRRLLRRAARHGKLLNIENEFLYKLCDNVILSNQDTYPELLEQKDYIIRIVKAEEERFGKTIDQGMDLLSNLIDKMEGKDTFGGEESFKLYDTFGFPIDLTREILEERGIKLDEKPFHKLMEQQRERARKAREEQSDSSWASEIVSPTDKPTEFLGYNDFKTNSELQYILKNNEVVKSVSSGDECIFILDRTPFYAEGGGQVGDTGYISNDKNLIVISNCIKIGSSVFLHYGKVESGQFNTKDMVVAEVDCERRKSIMRNHTSAHMLQSALITVLGDHIHQAGSYVDEEKVRFDFSHFEGVSDQQIKEIEHVVNTAILDALPVKTKTMTMDEAKKIGAITILGEEYGESVRVINIKGYSTELCGGTHVDNTSKLGLFKIISESSIAAGVRRIEGTTGFGVLDLYNSTETILSKAAEVLKVQAKGEVVKKIQANINEFREKDKEIEILNNMIAKNVAKTMTMEIKPIDGIKFISMMLKNYNIDILKTAVLNVVDTQPDTVIIISNTDEDKSVLISAAGSEAIKKGAHAGNLAREVAKLTGGSGGGRPTLAMAGVKDEKKLKEAISSSINLIEKMLK